MRVPFELQYGNVGNLTDLGQTDYWAFWSAVVHSLSVSMTYGHVVHSCIIVIMTDDTVHVFAYRTNM